MKQINNELSEYLLLLCDLEVQIQEEFDDKDIINSINEHKKSINFFIKNKIYDRALYEVKNLTEDIIFLLTEV
jgi:hypothetical protein